MAQLTKGINIKLNYNVMNVNAMIFETITDTLKPHFTKKINLSVST